MGQSPSEKLTIPQLVKQFPTFQGSLLYLKEFATCPYPKPDKSQVHCLKMCFIEHRTVISWNSINWSAFWWINLIVYFQVGTRFWIFVIRNPCFKTGNKNWLISTLIKRTNKVVSSFCWACYKFHPFQTLFLITIDDLKLCDSPLCIFLTLYCDLILHIFGQFIFVTDLLILTGNSIVKIAAVIMRAANISNIKRLQVLPQYI